ncbi:hypothetical protein ACNFR7_09770 [Streptomyces sp. RM1]|uniref:hypothetical protein n=1 Tax=Streptomyces misionensis TaxID=67331 RepID=UPI003BAEB4A1
MDETCAAKLQIYSVEEETATTAICIVRCVGGAAHAGQQFEVMSGVERDGGASCMKLDWIRRYEKPTNFLEPPHNAKVHLSGEGVEELKRGVIIEAVASKNP